MWAEDVYICPHPVGSLNALKRLRCEKNLKNMYFSIRISAFAETKFLLQKIIFACGFFNPAKNYTKQEDILYMSSAIRYIHASKTGK